MRITLPDWAFSPAIIAAMIAQLDEMMIEADHGTSVTDIVLVKKELERLDTYIRGV